MKTITIDDKKIQISDESYEAFKKQFVAKDKAILWKPEENGKYFYVSYVGITDSCSYNGHAMDSFYYQLGNAFKTKEEAQQALDTGWIAKRKAEVRILRLIAENDFESAESDSCFIIFYNQTSRDFTVYRSKQVSEIDMKLRFKSESDAQKVIDAMTPELKILFGVIN